MALSSVLFASQAFAQETSDAPAVVPRDWAAGAPQLRHYICYRTPHPIDIDGRLSEPTWGAVEWSRPFVDIEGAVRSVPRWRTRVKMLWDERYLYIGAELQEPHVWATLTERDAVIYQDDDFEVFIDPDGDTHNYYELEINALGTVWDLLLVKPYRDGGPALHEWDIDGLRTAVTVQGTLNDPSDEDGGWTVELALPWDALAQHAPEARAPQDGEPWRINFSRVDWHVETVEDRYRKRADPNGRPLPEENWVWSPQLAVNMHMPEMWGIVQFSDVAAGAGEVPFSASPDDEVRWALRQIYYAQRSYNKEQGRYTADLADLGLTDLEAAAASIRTELALTDSGYEAMAMGEDGHTRWLIAEDGRIWRSTDR